MSVIIPVKNGAATLERCLVALKEQTISKEMEVIILDSMSRDESRKIATHFGCRIVNIHEGSFNHGLTRNLGVQYASSDFLFYTVQDAFLSQNDLLEKMIRHFAEERIMGVCGHQAVPHEKDKNPMLWHKRYSEPVIEIREIKDVEKFKSADQTVQQSLIAWDDVVAMYRKTALIQQPFAEAQFAEDWIWSRDALLRGWKLIYDPSLVVYHYHHSNYMHAYKVAYAVNYHFYKFFNFKPGIPPLLDPVLKTLYHVGKNRELNIKEKLYWVCNNLFSRLGTFNSHINFLIHNFTGGFKSVEKRYYKVCKSVPQGRTKPN